MRNIILFGGDFNPVHNGHINMAVAASKYLGEAPVVFIPAKIAIWKDESIDFKHKVNMIRLAIKDIPNMYISEWENENGKERTYSIETVRHFKELYPDDKLYLLIGNDQVNAFDRWKEAEEISKLVQIIYFVRPGHPLNNDNVHIYNMERVPGEEKNIDSSSIRNLERSDTTPEVLKYIEENELYYIPKIKSYLIERRYVHTMSVADLSYKIALKNKVVDGDKVYTAALLHDIAKSIPHDKAYELMGEYFPWYQDRVSPDVYHQFLGALLAYQDFGVRDKEILSAIYYHTTGHANMSSLEKLLFEADKIEPTRNFPSKWMIDACLEDYEDGFVKVLEDNRKYLTEIKSDIDNVLTDECYEFYLDK